MLLLDEACGEEAAEAGEAVAGEGADDAADYYVAEVVLADEDAADSNQSCPCEKNPAIPLDNLDVVSFRRIFQTEFQSEPCTSDKAERIGSMCREKAVSTTTLKNVQSILYHKFVVKRPYATNSMFDKIGKLVTEDKCQ